MNYKLFTLLPTLLLIACSEIDQKKTQAIKELAPYESLELNDEVRSKIGWEHFQKTTDGYTYYELKGPDSAETVILIHGFSVPSYIWDSTYKACLSKGYRVLRYDNYGRGYSDRPNKPNDIFLFYRQLSEMIDSLNINPPFNMVGLSWGGRLASFYTAKNPDKVKKLVMVDASGFEPYDRKDSTPIDVTEEEIQLAIKEKAPSMAEGQVTDFFKPENFSYWSDLYKPQMQYKGFIRSTLSTRKNIRDLTHYIRQIAHHGTPVKAIYGKEDKVIPPDVVIPMAKELIPTIDVSLIDSAGHLPQIEKAQKFNHLLFEFLEQ